MQSPFMILAIVLLVGCACRSLLALPQALRINRELRKLRASGEMSSVGMSKHWYGSRVYVLVADRDGTVRSGHKLGGVTIFSGFVRDKDLTATSAQEILDSLDGKKRLSQVDQAKRMAASYLVKGAPQDNVAPAEAASEDEDGRPLLAQEGTA